MSGPGARLVEGLHAIPENLQLESMVGRLSLEMIDGWNPMPATAIAVALSTTLFVAFWLLRDGRIRSAGARANAWSGITSAGFYPFYERVFATLTPPLADAFSGRLSAGIFTIAERTRKIYTGDGQTYSLYILYYFFFVYAASAFLHSSH
jgi:hypothetical protein